MISVGCSVAIVFSWWVFMNKFKTILVLGTLVAFSVLADECSDIIPEMEAMKKAQGAIQMSLVANHTMIADTMESYSEALSSTAGRAFKTISSNMLASSTSIRDRSQKAKKTAIKLDLATTELIQKITKCLK